MPFVYHGIYRIHFLTSAHSDSYTIDLYASVLGASSSLVPNQLEFLVEYIMCNAFRPPWRTVLYFVTLYLSSARQTEDACFAA